MRVMRSRLKHFLIGMSRVLDLGAPQLPRPRTPADDARKMAGDWRRVGGDMRRAMAQFEATHLPENRRMPRLGSDPHPENTR